MASTNDLRQYIRSSCDARNPQFFPPYVAGKLKVSMPRLTEMICDLYDEYPTMRVVEKMLHLRPKPVPMYYEVCDTKYRRGNVIPQAELWSWCLDNQKKDQHISVFTHDKRWVEEVGRFGKVASAQGEVVGVPGIYLEMDRKTTTDGTTPKTKAINDAAFLVGTFGHPDHIVGWFSGNNSVHVVVDSHLFGNPLGSRRLLTGRGKTVYNLAHKIAGDVRYANGLVDVWNTPLDKVVAAHRKVYPIQVADTEVKQIMENIDPNLYSPNSLIRAPFSYHEKSGGQKVVLDLPMVKTLPPAPVDFPQTPPYLLHWYYECLEPTVKRRGPVVIPDENEIIAFYSKHFEDFHPDDVRYDGWVRELYNPFVPVDTNPGVSINLTTGHMIDFGDPDWNLSFEQLKQRIK